MSHLDSLLTSDADGGAGGYLVKDAAVEGCKLGTFCNSFWIDNDDHGGYTNMLVNGVSIGLGLNTLYGGG